jgi:hypothetical protein
MLHCWHWAIYPEDEPHTIAETAGLLGSSH